MYDPGAFQTATSVLGLGNKNNPDVLQPFGSLRYRLHWFSKPDIMGASLPSADPPGWGSDSLLFWRDSHGRDIPLICESLHGECG